MVFARTASSRYPSRKTPRPGFSMRTCSAHNFGTKAKGMLAILFLLIEPCGFDWNLIELHGCTDPGRFYSGPGLANGCSLRCFSIYGCWFLIAKHAVAWAWMTFGGTPWKNIVQAAFPSCKFTEFKFSTWEQDPLVGTRGSVGSQVILLLLRFRAPGQDKTKFTPEGIAIGLVAPTDLRRVGFQGSNCGSFVNPTVCYTL